MTSPEEPHAEERRHAFAVSEPFSATRHEEEAALPACISLESLSLGGVATMNPHMSLPKKYRAGQPGERSTYQGAGVVPVTRTEHGEVRILLWQARTGRKTGVRWYDFGGKKEQKSEYTSHCAARKFAKQTYGVFGCGFDMPLEEAKAHLQELYQGTCNLELMMHTSREWTKLQLCNDDIRMFYNDIHEYHCYFVLVPYVEAEVLNEISKIVDSGKRVFRWLSAEAVDQEVVAPRLHTDGFKQQLSRLPTAPDIQSGQTYGDGRLRRAAGNFSAAVV